MAEVGVVELRRLSSWEAPRLALRAARVMDRKARARVGPDGTPRPGLRRIGWLFPPPPARLYVLVVVTLVDLLTNPFWLASTASGPAALASTSPLTAGAPGRERGRTVVVIGAGAAALAMATLLTVVAELAVGPVAVVPLAASLAPFLWPFGAGLLEAWSTRSLAPVQADLVQQATAPVYLGGGLVAMKPHAARGLLHVLVARADEDGATIVVRTEAGPLVRLYRGAGFKEVAAAATWWGTAVLMVRPPRAAGVASEGRTCV